MLLAQDTADALTWSVDIPDPGLHGWNLYLTLGVVFLAVALIVGVYAAIALRRAETAETRAPRVVTLAAAGAILIIGLICTVPGVSNFMSPADDHRYARAAEDNLVARGITAPPQWKPDTDGGTRTTDEALGRQGGFTVYTGDRSGDSCHVYAREVAGHVDFRSGCLPGREQAVTFADRDAFSAAVADAGYTVGEGEHPSPQGSGPDTTSVPLDNEHSRCWVQLADGQVPGSDRGVWMTSSSCPIPAWEPVHAKSSVVEKF
jgi:hypothetical protein